MSYLNKRREHTSEKIQNLHGQLNRAADLLRDKACIYATGSFGRLESGDNSDLDLFIVSKTIDTKVGPAALLSNLDAIVVKAELISAIRKLDMPEFDGDGKYLAHYSVNEFTDSLGKPEDDAKNTLTGRLLLFLESQPLLGGDVYRDIIDEVIANYWRDYGDHADDFMPAFLANDILRLWRTFCVNYEARTQRDPQDKKIEGKIKNYKLKHSRMLTCYSALLYLLGIFKLNKTVSIDSAKEMTKLTPTDRLEWLLQDRSFESIHDPVKKLLSKYEEFLERTDRPKDELIVEFEKNSTEWMKGSYEFGDLMFETLQELGKDNKFYRLIVV
ncbi:hypothetical protein HD884_004282 [Ochrobactrum intermedium]|uniref:hypothetical protein n=1 Tax=Brucella intermedia TaxID=94625 RepID=UPI0015CDBB02|nr:hypothetical protein [Brucella intermedia]NYD84173.1 hypothetical protein [Brucella intermedia]